MFNVVLFFVIKIHYYRFYLIFICVIQYKWKPQKKFKSKSIHRLVIVITFRNIFCLSQFIRLPLKKYVVFIMFDNTVYSYILLLWYSVIIWVVIYFALFASFIFINHVIVRKYLTQSCFICKNVYNNTLYGRNSIINNIFVKK